MKLPLILFLLLGCATFLHAQNGTVSGRVTDINGEPLIGASLTAGDAVAITDTAGRYTITLPFGEWSLTASYLGYESRSRKLTVSDAPLTVDFALAATTQLLQTATVTGSRYEQALGEVTVSLEVIKPALLENTNTIQVNEVIEKIPSVTVVDGQANIRSGSGYSYGAGSRVLLLIDDLPALQGDASFPSWSFVPVENIAQIEVVKGAGSALYGSSAMNGIINIRTAYPTSDPYTKVSLMGTAYDAPRNAAMKWWNDTTATPGRLGAQLAHRQRIGEKFDLVLGGYYLREQSFRQGEYDRYGRFNVNTRYRFSDKLNVQLNTNVQTGRSANFFIWQNDTTGALLPRDGTLADNQNFKITVDPSVTYYRGTGRHKLMGRLYHFQNEQGTDLTDQSVRSTQYYGEYQFQRKIEPAQLVITTGVVASQTLVNAALYGNTTHSASNAAFYVQADKKFGERLNVSAGLRYESNTISNPDSAKAPSSEVQPVTRIGLNYQLADYTYLRASYGEGYRFPTIAEKYISTNIGNALFVFPNDTLRSETGWSAELGIKQGFKLGKGFQGYVDVAAFWMEYNDMMEFTFGVYPQGFGFASLNIGDTRIRGLDVSIAGQGKIGEMTHQTLIGYTYTEPTYRNFEEINVALNSSPENILKYRFEHIFKLDYAIDWQGLSAGVAVLGYSHMKSIDAVFENDFILPGVRTFREEYNSGTWVFNARIAYQLTPQIKASILAKNLTNATYALRPALLNAPRNIAVRIDYQIQ